MIIDLLTVGRVSMDLFARDIGAEFHDITAFQTGVGGSPVNIAIGASRLGLNAGAFTAVGDDEVGRFVRQYLEREGVVTEHVLTKEGHRTGMAVVGVQPPDRFPLLFYREDPADIHLSLEDAKALPLADVRAVQLSGTAMSRGGTRDVSFYLAEWADALERSIFLDLDLRPDQWSHPLAYGLNMRQIIAHCDVIIGTEEEFYAALAPDPEAIMAGERLEDPSALHPLLLHISDLYGSCLVLKRGERGVRIYIDLDLIDVPGYPVEIVNTVGAGDAFASGLIAGCLAGWHWDRAARFANACGALAVTRHGCARALPTLAEVQAFIAEKERAGG